MSAFVRTRPERIRMTEDYEAEVRALLGPPPLGRPGVLHGAAVFRTTLDRLAILRINAQTPVSPTDAFVLALSRARADVILTTGQNLRDEPDAHARLSGGAEAWLARWRRDVCGLVAPARLAVLTGSGDIDLAHPAMRGSDRPLVLTTPRGRAELEARSEGADVESIVGDGFDVRDWIALLRDERDFQTVLIEAGPSTARHLYAAPGLVDELVLSICPTDSVVQAVRGPEFVSEAAIAAVGLACVHETERLEPSGRWSFQRQRR
jgi:riboflavin biosynthesis pyrimidine reductase